jgi:uncharacterized protein
MLLDFECGNFRSFRDPVRLTLEAVKAYKEREEENVFTTAAGHRLLKSAAIYGPNASGKSNLVQAVAFVNNFLRNSAGDSQIDKPIPVVPFLLDTATKPAPSRFQMTFLDGSDHLRYGFETDAKRIHSEWLFITDFSKKRARERALFLREGSDIDVKPGGITDAKALTKRTRANALFLSTAAMWNEPNAGRFISLMSRLRAVSGVHDYMYRDISFAMLQHPDTKPRIIEAIRMADFGIEDLTGEETSLDPSEMSDLPQDVLKELANGKISRLLERKVLARHTVFNGDRAVGPAWFDLEADESAGTKKFFRMMGPILDTLENGYTVFVDELEEKLHPLLTRAIVRLFHDPRINTKNAQLVFCTHDVGLLSHGGLRRDQVWFAEKSAKGASALTPLSDFENVRKDTQIEDGYIQGRFGAIPFLGGTEELARLMRS